MSQIVTIKVECEDWKEIEDLCDAAYLCGAVYREDCWGRVISIESEKKKE
jgi:hypothetical protein